MVQKLYYSLLSKEKKNPESRWTIEFGDYDRLVVVQEKDDQKYSNTCSDDAKLEYKIIKTLSSQKAIEDAVKELNNKL